MSRSTLVSKVILSIATAVFILTCVIVISPTGINALTWGVILLGTFGSFVVGFLPYKRLAAKIRHEM